MATVKITDKEKITELEETDVVPIVRTADDGSQALYQIAASGFKGKDGFPSIVEQTEQIVSIDPGVLNVWTSSVTTLVVSFNANSDATQVAEYMMRFTTGYSGINITLPSTITWQETPEWETNTTYEISVVDNLGIIASW